MGLLVVDHLHAMLGRAQPPVGFGEVGREVGLEMAGARQRGDRVEGRRRPQRGVAAAVDQLPRLGEELDLADAAAPALDVIAGAEALAARIMVAHLLPDRPDFLERAEIERPAPDERLDRPKEGRAQRGIAGAGAGADERRPLPPERGRFVIGNGGVERQDDRSRLGRGPKPQIDPRDIAVGGALLQQFDQPAADPHRRLARLVALPPGQRLRVEQQ